MQSIAQNLTYGLFVGSIYGVAAAGLALIFGVLRVLNVAHGELLMFGGYIGFWLFTLMGVDPFISLPVAALAMFVVGLLLDRTVFQRLVHLPGETKLKNSLLVSFGLTLILQNTAQQFFTADERAIQLDYSGASLNLFGVILPYTRLISLAVALGAILALHFFLHRTFSGKAIRAVSEDGESAALAGINVERTYLYTFGIGAALAGIAGGLVVLGYGIAPTIGLTWTLKALVVITLAGTGSVIGIFPAGLLLGLVEALSGTVLGSAYQEVVGLVMFLLVLMLRPSGLFGKS
ncbi:MAG TPA: branched-chain amino acid ABC transporter permease [Chloroflexia bacterium]|nr:branched-chain amino acid ABC transporter permease [Chloroflexia bacterium]